MQTCVLFVDDEPLILSLYEALSPDLGPDFTVRTARDGNEALRVMDQTEVQIVVSDLEMPEMPGGELLTHVEKKYPKAMRVVISGYDDELHVARCLTFGHRYLRKPVEPEALATTLKRLAALRETLADENLKALLSSSDALPSPPETYLCLSDALQRDESSTRDFAEIIESDPLLSANLLEVVNSPAFGLSVQIESIQELFEVVGVHVVRSLILSLHTKDFFQPRTPNGGLFEELWQHALETAALSRKLASLERLNFRECQTCYVAGLLHDIGQFVLAAQVNHQSAGECPNMQALLKYEREQLGVSHTVIGAYLLGLWGLPEPVVITAELHHNLDAVPAHAYNPILYIHTAENISKTLQISELDINFLRKAGKVERLAVWRDALPQARS
jgi:putative nucleotidyltransferase with HDIG domain